MASKKKNITPEGSGSGGEKSKELLLYLLDAVDKVDLIDPSEIPDISLYMDQVTTYMDEHLKQSRRRDEDKILTKTMINNYAKNRLLPPPEKKKYTKEHIADMILHDYADKQIFILASLVQNRKGHYRELFESMRSKGYINMRIDGDFVEIIRGMIVAPYRKHNIEVVIDKLQVSVKNMERLTNSVATASNLGKGIVVILEKNAGATPKCFAVTELVEVEGNSLLANQWVDSFANIKEQVFSKANDQRGQWESNIHQKVNMLVSEKLRVDFETEQEEQRLKEKKKIRIKGIILAIVYGIVLLYTLFTIRPKGYFGELVTIGGVTGAYFLITKLIFPNFMKKLQNYDSI